MAVSIFQKKIFLNTTVMCSAVLLLGSMIGHGFAAPTTTEIGSNTSLKEPTESGYSGYDGSSRYTPAVYYKVSESGELVINGSIADGTIDLPTVYQNWNGSDGFDAPTGRLNLSPLFISGPATSVESNVTINTHVTRESGEQATDQDLSLEGIYFGNGGTLINKGRIDLSAQAGSTRANTQIVSVDAEVYGINSDSDKVFNNGTITLDVTAGTAVMVERPLPSENSDVNASAHAYGLVTSGGDINNTAEINLKAKGGSATSLDNESDAFAFVDVFAINPEASTATNTGNIIINVEGGTASTKEGLASVSVYASAIRSSTGTANNSGNIKITAKGGLAQSTSGSAQANVNVSAFSIEGGHVINSGNITIEATGGTAIENLTSNGSTSATATAAIVVGGSFTNSGKIDIKSTAGEGSKALAYGIYSFADTTIHSSGLISVEAIGNASSKDYQIYSNSNAITLTGYAMAFGSDLTLDEYTNAIKAGGGVTFEAAADAGPDVSGAKLYAYTTNDTLEGEAYTLPNLVEGGDLADQSFGELETMDVSSQSGTDWQASFVDGSDNTQIIFNYTPQTSTPQNSSVVRSKVLVGGTEIIKNLLLNQHNTAQTQSVQLTQSLGYAPASQVQQDVAQMPDITAGPRRETKGEIFFSPYYSDLQGDANPMGYDATSVGLVAGYNHHLTQNLTVGVSGFYASTDIDYTGAGYEDRSEDVDTYAGGVQFAWSKDNFRLSGLSTYAYSKNDYRDSAPTNLETADYNGRSLLSSLNLQYMAKFGANTFVPELGVSHQWVNREAYTTDNSVAANTTYGALNDNRVDVSAKLSWYGEIQMEDFTLKPHLGAGIRQALTDGKLESSMSSGANGYALLETDEDRTHFTTSASLGVQGEVLSASLGYVGEYSANTSDSSLYGRIAYRF